jgi:uncharacterized protein involved in exopolysaccharide biosynthesis
VEAALAKAKKELEETLADRPGKVAALQRQIASLQAEKKQYVHSPSTT